MFLSIYLYYLVQYQKKINYNKIFCFHHLINKKKIFDKTKSFEKFIKKVATKI